MPERQDDKERLPWLIQHLQARPGVTFSLLPQEMVMLSISDSIPERLSDISLLKLRQLSESRTWTTWSFFQAACRTITSELSGDAELTFRLRPIAPESSFFKFKNANTTLNSLLPFSFEKVLRALLTSNMPFAATTRAHTSSRGTYQISHGNRYTVYIYLDVTTR